MQIVISVYNVYTFASDIVAFSITTVLKMQYCTVYFARYSNYTNDTWGEQST